MTKKTYEQCSHCSKKLERTPYGSPEDSLLVKLDGGYASFVDTIVCSRQELATWPFTHHLCHECAHELMLWLNVPLDKIKRWHQKQPDADYCDGWTI